MTATTLFKRVPIAILYAATGVVGILAAIPKIADQSRPEVVIGAIAAGCGIILIIAAAKIFRNGISQGTSPIFGFALAVKLALSSATGEITIFDQIGIPLAISIFALSAWFYAIEEAEPNWDD